MHAVRITVHWPPPPGHCSGDASIPIGVIVVQPPFRSLISRKKVLAGQRMAKQRGTRAALAGALMLLHVVSPVGAQTGERGAPQRHNWTLDVQQGDTIKLTLRATDVPLSEIAHDLARRLKLPITVEPELRQSPVTAQFERRDLNEALPLLVSLGRVCVDYEMARADSPGKPVAVFFQSETSDAPPLPVAKSQSEVHVIAGNTEDGE